MNIKVHFYKRDIAHLIQVGYKKSSLLKNKKALFFTFLIACMTSLIHAQRNPVEVMTTIAPPYTPYLSEYGTATSNHLQVTVLANDSRLVNLPVKLQIEVENMQTGTLFKTRQQANTPILYLSGGSVLNLSGLDLSSYFQAQNLMFYGMDMSRYLTGKRIPDGYYRIGFTIVDANRGQVISNTAYTNPGWFLLNNPPQLNQPRRNEVLRVEEIQSVKFEWFPRHLGSMNSSFGTSYTFELYTLRVPNIQPAQYVNSAMPDYKVDVSSTSFRLSMGDYPLEKGVRYAWRVQAKANNVLSMFLNDGYSEVSSFTYGSSCPTPEDVQVNVLNTEDVSFSCSADPQHTAYNIRIKKSNDNNGWYTREFYTANFDLKSMMEAGTLYKYQLAAKCNTEASEYSALQEFRMKTAENTTIECGREDQAVAIINDVPKPNLVIGDYITNGPWELLITEVSGGDGTFSGKGRLRVPWFLNAKVRMKFDNIQVNEHNQVTAGMFESITDTTGRFFVEDVSDYLAEGDQYGNVLTGREHAGLELGYVVPDVSQLNVDYNNGNVTVSSNNGSSETMEIDDPEDGVIISDSDGNIFAANKDGEVVKIGKIEEPEDEDNPTAGTSESYKENKSNYDNLSGTSSITVTFENADDWALDHRDPDYGSSAFNSEYEEFGGQYVPWKYIPIGIPGKVKFKVSGDLPSGGELVFRTPAGTRYLPQDNNILTLASARDRDALEIYALVQQDDSITQSLGKLKVASYPKIRHKVKLVPMYDATIDGSKVQEEVNKIYKPYGIVWEVEVKEPFTDSSWDEGEEGLQTSGSGFFSELTPEMKALNTAYQKEPDFDSESLYLFIFNQQSSDNKNMLGDMPLESQFGYIFMQDKASLYHTIAHEVAHGMFQLRHPFSSKYGLQEMATNNLLDYKGGTELKKYQWDAIHDPRKILAWAQDESEGAMIATADTGKFEISIADMNVEFAPGIGEMTLKFKLGDSTKVLMERYSDEDFITKIFVFDKNGQKLYESEKEATVSGEFVWDGYIGDKNKDSLIYENGPFKLSLALTNADSSVNNWQDFKDWAYEVFLGDSINTFTTGCDTSFNILNDPIKLDWLANFETYKSNTYITTSEQYSSFITNGKNNGVFPNEDFELLEWLNEHEVKTTSVKFLNATVKDVIKEFGMVIHAADSILKADNPSVYSSIKNKYSGTHSGLFVRYIGGTTSPSNHSTGAAVDFRVKYNPMYTSSDKERVGLVKYITGVDLLAEKQSSDALYNASKAFLQKFHGNNTGTTQEVIDKYTLVHAYDIDGVIGFSDLDQLSADTLIVNDFQTEKQRLINVLNAHKSSVVFNQNSKTAIDSLIAHLNRCTSDTLPKYEHSQLNDFFTERKAFYAMVTDIGFADLKAFYKYFKEKDRFENFILEHGFCDIEVEVYEAFDKAHRMVTKKLIGTEYGVEWGGIYDTRIDAMHFCMPKEVVLELMKQ